MPNDWKTLTFYLAMTLIGAVTGVNCLLGMGHADSIRDPQCLAPTSIKLPHIWHVAYALPGQKPVDGYSDPDINVEKCVMPVDEPSDTYGSPEE